jgi:hypothetical protein
MRKIRERNEAPDSVLLSETVPESSLLCYVIITAIRDARGVSCNDYDTGDALRWLCSESNDIGSFRWYCDMTGIDPQYVRRMLRDEGTL